MPRNSLPTTPAEATTAATAARDYDEHFLLGYIGAGLRIAVAKYPDDRNLSDCLAMHEAWSAHQDEQRAAAVARVQTRTARRCRDCLATSGLVMLPYGPLDPLQWECTDGCETATREGGEQR